MSNPTSSPTPEPEPTSFDQKLFGAVIALCIVAGIGFIYTFLYMRKENSSCCGGFREEIRSFKTKKNKGFSIELETEPDVKKPLKIKHFQTFQNPEAPISFQFRAQSAMQNSPIKLNSVNVDRTRSNSGSLSEGGDSPKEMVRKGTQRKIRVRLNSRLSF